MVVVTRAAPRQGMTTTNLNRPLPHHRLTAYGVALELLRAVRTAEIRDRALRDQAMRAAKSACLNIAEAAGRTVTVPIGA